MGDLNSNTMPADSAPVLTLELDSVLRVAGEELVGEVLLDFKELQKTPVEEVYVKLRGSVFTRITRQIGQSTITRRSRIELIRENLSVWSKGSAYPAPNEHILRLPFRFLLPPDLLPSCQYSAFRRYAAVAYSVEVVGSRSGLHFNKRIMRPIPLLPYNLTGAQLRDNLQIGWGGGSRVHRCNKNIRRGIWGDYSNVAMALSLPDIASLPMFVSIPFTLTVVTTSKPMKRDEAQESEPIFPTPPRSPEGVELKLLRQVSMTAGGWRESGTTKIASLGGLGPAEVETNSRTAVIEVPMIDVMHPVWIPEVDSKSDEKKQKGTWKQEVSITSSFKLTCPPSFDSRTMTVNYLLAMQVDFPGIGNDLKGEVPISVISSMLPPGRGARWDGPPPELDLPPTYMSTTDWDHDEKSSD